MGNSVSLHGSLPCTCLYSRKVVPVPGEPIQINGNGHPSVGSKKTSNGWNDNGHATKEEPASSAYVNNVSLASPLLQTHARETFPLCLLLIGLDGAGKTSFLHWFSQRYPVMGKGRRTSQIRQTDMEDPKPTMGFSREEARYKKHSVVIHDLGGGKSIRGIWKNYYAEAHGIALVVDSSVPLGNERWEELNSVIDQLIASDDSGLQSRPLLVLLNKQDETSAINVEEFESTIKVDTLAEEYSMPLRIIPVCIREKHPITNITTRQQLCSKSLEDAIQWMVKSIELHFPILHMKVQQDTRAQIAHDEQLRRERTARLKALRDAAELDNAADDPSDVIGSNPFIPLDEHLQRVERRKSSLVPGGVAFIEVVPLRSAQALSGSRSEPSLSRISDDFSGSDVLMDDRPVEGDFVQTGERWRSSQDVTSSDADGDAGAEDVIVADAVSIGDISETGDEPVKLPVLKTSRPPVYKRLGRMGNVSQAGVS